MTAALLPNETSAMAKQLTPTAQAAVQAACRRIAPVWPLQSFVAVNPFLGLSHLPFRDANQLLQAVSHASLFMDAGYFQQALQNGKFTAEDIRFALSQLPTSTNPAATNPAANPTGSNPAPSAQSSPATNGPQPTNPALWLQELLSEPAQAQHLLTVADWLDHQEGNTWRQGGKWAAFCTEEISKWCASYFDQGQATWAMPQSDLPLYQAWRQAARLDRNPEHFGLPGFRAFVEALPDQEEAAIAFALQQLDVPPALLEDFLHRQLVSVSGWASVAAHADWGTGSVGHTRQLLAIRLAFDCALLSLATNWQCRLVPAEEPAGGALPRYVAQAAAETAFRRQLQTQWQLANSRPSDAFADQTTPRPALQAVFCIDVRSEPYRRALEAQSSQLQTIGFAGFFGLPMAWESEARCPVLLEPSIQVHADDTFRTSSRKQETPPVKKELGSAWKHLLTSAAACFSAVEVGGLAYAPKLFQQALRGQFPAASPEQEEAPLLLTSALTLPQKADLVAGILRNMSLQPQRLAPIVLFCGHGSSTTNNPYAASLDCGACGGHKGDRNAQYAAALANDPEVRALLAERGQAIPADTIFVAGLHNTTTDEVTLIHPERLPEAARLRLQGWLDNASAQARQSRYGLPQVEPVALAASSVREDALLEEADYTAEELEQQAQRRAQDWAEVRPEWGLAGNAAFIAAPRARTKSLNLKGRAFLHDYDAAADSDASVLQLILTAPVVVASWINLQYYGSTVNNQLYGSGDKTLHNVVGRFGVWEGNGGDLRTGLPLQSLHDGQQWVHEPLRLLVVVEAPLARIDQILAAHPSVEQLFANGWLQLLATDGNSFQQRRPDGSWQPAEL